MARKRAATLTVFGILNIVFGALGLCCGLVGVGVLAFLPTIQKKMQEQPGSGNAGNQWEMLGALQKHLAANVPGYVAIQWGQAGLSLILCIVLISAGIGLLRASAAGRWTSVGYSLVVIVIQLATMVYTIGFVNPATEEFMRQQAGGGMQTMQQPNWLSTLTSIGGACLGMTYAIILLVFMLLPSTGRAVAGEGPTDYRPGDDYYDTDFGRQRRELPPEDSDRNLP